MALLDADSGQPLWSYQGEDEWLRHGRFRSDGEQLVVGLSGGRLLMFNRQGVKLWEQFTGEFPLVLEMDDTGTVYAAGKNRELASFAAGGQLNWRYRIPDHVVTAGADNMSADGQLIVVGTVAGWLYAFAPDGTLKWRRQLPSLAQGHNALDVTPDGQWILAGTNGANGGYLVIYHQDGTLAWQTQLTDRRAADDPSRGDHNDTGVITAAIADDGQTIAAGTGDSTIVIFTRE